MSRIYSRQKRPGTKGAESSYNASAVHTPSLVSGQSSGDLDTLMQSKYRQHFLEQQIPDAEAEADRIATSVSGARTPDDVKSQLGAKMGADFSNVTFHTDFAAAKQADSMGARAYTTGRDVYFGSGGFDPDIAAHELVHTVQQGMVGSSMQTTSAPTGGVQMWPGRKKTPPKKSRKQEAQEIMTQVVHNSDGYYENKALAHQKAMLDYQAREANGASAEELEQMLISIAKNDIDTDVDLHGLDDSAMYKNAKALQSVASDFPGLGIRSISANDTINSDMDSDVVTKGIRINRNRFSPRNYPSFNSTVKENMKIKKQTNTNANYFLAHEAGHSLHDHLTEKLQNSIDTNNLNVKMDSYKNTVGMILADAFSKYATKDARFKEILDRNLGAPKGDEPSDRNYLKQINAKTYVKSASGYSSLISDLVQNKYGSGYASKAPHEFYAEAVAEHYRNEAKFQKYTKDDGNGGRVAKFGYGRKLKKLQKNRSQLSDTIVEISKKLFHNEDERANFLRQFAE